MSTTPLSPPRNWTDRTSGRWFYAGYAAFCVLISIAGFGPAMVDTAGRPGTFTWLSVAHGMLFFTWLVVFVIQTLLVQAKKISIHRTLGTASLFLAAAMVTIGYIAAIAMTRRGFDLSGDLGLPTAPFGPVGQIIFPLLDIFEFALLVAAGYLYRRNLAAHKRIMLFATAAILPGSFAHVIGHFVPRHTHPNLIIPMVALSLAASAVYDLLRFRRIHPVSAWLGAGMFLIDALCNNLIGPSLWWHHFAQWLIS